MADTVVDSSIVIDYLRGRTEAKLLLDSLHQNDKLATHLVVQAEVISGARDLTEQHVIERFFQRFRMVSFNEQDALDSLALLNEKHFRVFPGLDIQRPYK